MTPEQIADECIRKGFSGDKLPLGAAFMRHEIADAVLY